jgi:hypothetical protein
MENQCRCGQFVKQQTLPHPEERIITNHDGSFSSNHCLTLQDMILKPKALNMIVLHLLNQSSESGNTGPVPKQPKFKKRVGKERARGMAYESECAFNNNLTYGRYGIQYECTYCYFRFVWFRPSPGDPGKGALSAHLDPSKTGVSS